MGEFEIAGAMPVYRERSGDGVQFPGWKLVCGIPGLQLRETGGTQFKRQDLLLPDRGRPPDGPKIGDVLKDGVVDGHVAFHHGTQSVCVRAEPARRG